MESQETACMSQSTVTTDDETRFLRIVQLLYKVTPTVVRVIFDRELDPQELQRTLNLNRVEIRKKTTPAQWGLMFPSNSEVLSKNFDITLMMCLLTILTDADIGNKHPETRIDRDADLTRLKYYRNIICHGHGTLSLDNFNKYWDDISQALVRLGGNDYIQICSDMKVKSIDNSGREILLELLNRSNNPIPAGLQDINTSKINEWEELDKKVVETRAIQRLYMILTTGSIATVIGPSGCGKSTAIQHIALKLQNEQGFEIIPANEPGDVKRYLNSKQKQLFLFDDICGKSSIQTHRIEDWERLSDDISSILERNQVKIVISSRSYISQDRLFRVDNLLNKAYCDLISEDLSLTASERKLIAKSYLTGDECRAIDNILHYYVFFPLLCALYSKRKATDIYKFFSSPVNVIKDELQSMMNVKDQTTISVLFLLTVYNNCIPEDFLSRKHLTNILEELSEEFEIEGTLSAKKVRNQLESLTNCYVKKTGSKYSVVHDKIFDILILFFGDTKLNFLLEHCHSNIIRDRFVYQTIIADQEWLANSDSDDCTVIVPKVKEIIYFDRLRRDLEDGFVTNVFTNRQLLCRSFRLKFVNYFDSSSDVLSKYLSKMEINIDDYDEERRTPLYISCWRGHMEIVELLIKHQCGVNVMNAHGLTPMYIASLKGHNDIVKRLIEQGGNINICSNYKKSPLHVAVLNGHELVVDILLKNNADPYQTDIQNKSCLYTASCLKYKNIVKKLLHHMADVEKIENYINSPLFASCENGNMEIVELLLKHGLNPNRRFGLENATPLYIASHKGHHEVVKILLEHQAYPYTLNQFKQSPLSIACRFSYIDVLRTLVEQLLPDCCCFQHEDSKKSFNATVREIVEELVQYGPQIHDHISLLYKAIRNGHPAIVEMLLVHIHDIDDPKLFQEGLSLLFLASKNGKTDIVKLLLDKKSDTYATFRYKAHGKRKVRNTLPYQAIFAAYREIAELLLKYGGDPDTFNNDCIKSPLHAASKMGYTDIVKVLLNHQCDPNTCDIDGMSPLYIASQRGHIQIVELLLEHSCDSVVLNKARKSPLNTAIEEGHMDIVRLLMEHNWDPNMRDQNGKSPVYVASKKGRKDFVELLLKQNCDPTSCDKDGKSPLYIALEEGHMDIVRLLIEHNWDPNMRDKDGKSLLYVASKKGLKDFVELLLEEGCDPTFCDEDGKSPLYIALEEDHIDIVRLLLEQPRDVTVRYEDVKSPLYTAIKNGSACIVRLLLEYKSDPERSKLGKRLSTTESKDDDRVVRTCICHFVEEIKLPFHLVIIQMYPSYASYEENMRRLDICYEINIIIDKTKFKEIVKILLNHKYDPNIGDTENKTPLYLAVELSSEWYRSCKTFPTFKITRDFEEIIFLLLDKKCDPNIPDSSGRTPLYIASSNGHLKLVNILLDHNSDPNICDNTKKSPLYVAAERGYSDTVELLLKYKSNPYLFDEKGITPSDIARDKGHAYVVELLTKHSVIAPSEALTSNN